MTYDLRFSVWIILQNNARMTYTSTYLEVIDHTSIIYLFFYTRILYIYIKKKMVTFFLLLVCYKFRNTIPEHRERIRMKWFFFSGISFFVIDCVAIILLTVSLHTHARVTKLNTIQTVKCCYSHVPIFYFFFQSNFYKRSEWISSSNILFGFFCAYGIRTIFHHRNLPS